MRNHQFIKIITLCSLLITGITYAATTTVNGGTIHFRGEVVNAACSVDAASVDQTVQLGQVKTVILNEAGKTSPAVGFNIQLNDCDTSVASKAAIAFSGVTLGADNPTALALENSASGGASNVGIQVLDSAGKAQSFDGASFSTPATLTDGTNVLPFQARYIATGTATPGIANANANFKVQYQ